MIRQDGGCCCGDRALLQTCRREGFTSGIPAFSTSGMSKPPPACHCMTNGSSYSVALRKRGRLLILVDMEMTQRTPRDGRPRRSPVVSDAAILLCQREDLRDVDVRPQAAWDIKPRKRSAPGLYPICFRSRLDKNIDFTSLLDLA